MVPSQLTLHLIHSQLSLRSSLIFLPSAPVILASQLKLHSLLLAYQNPFILSLKDFHVAFLSPGPGNEIIVNDFHLKLMLTTNVTVRRTSRWSLLPNT